MLLQHQDKIGVLIDGANLYGATKHLEYDVDYQRLLQWLKSQGKLVRAFYFTAVKEDLEFQSIKPLIDWLDYNGYKVVSKPASQFMDDEGRPKVKGNMDIELCVSGLRLARHVDKMFLFSGDGDFAEMVEAMQEDHGTHVTVISHRGTVKGSNGRITSYVADKLRRQCDLFIDLDEPHFRSAIGKEREARVFRQR